MQNLEGLITLAEQNNEEGWKTIDKLLPQYAGDQEFFDWAKNNLKNPDGNLRDLAASILEKTSLEIGDDVITNLFTLMDEKDEENLYPSFRAACALARRREDPRVVVNIGQVRSKLEKYVDDEGVKEIVSNYLQQMNNSK